MATKHSSPHLLDLPNEVLIQILQNLYKADLVEVCQTSKTLFSLAQCLLYAEITIKSNLFVSHRFYKLLRSIIANPCLGQGVRSIELSLEGPDCAVSKYALPEQFLDLPQIVAYLSTIPCFTPQSIWETALSEQSIITISALTAILLVHVPNAHTIRVSEGYIKVPLYLEYATAVGGLQLPNLTKLEVLSSSLYSTFYDPWQESPLYWLLHRKSLRAVSGVITDKMIVMLLRDKPPLVFTFTDLHCDYLGLPFLPYLLSMTPGLQTLLYRPWADTRPNGFDCTRLHLALCHVKNTIRRITIQPGSTKSRLIQGAIGSFSDFHRLEELELPWVLLTTIGDNQLRDILPRSLRRLKTNDLLSEYANSRMCIKREELFESFFGEWEACIPLLKEVVGEGSYTLSGPARRGRDALRRQL
ncbi:hypothetical protein BJX70DRAFT_50954 [Aspergillus crustosus]